MSIQDIINSGANVTIAVSASDLQDFAYSIVEKVKNDIEQKIIAGKSDVYYSPEQVVVMLSVSRSTLWRWNKVGYLKHVEVGGYRRYRKVDIDKIVGCES